MTTEKMIAFKIPELLQFDLDLFRQKLGWNDKSGKTKCILHILSDYLGQKLRAFGIEPLSYGNPLGYKLEEESND